MQFQAAVCYEKSDPFGIRTQGSLRSEDVFVKIVGSGLCHTDFAARDELFLYRCHVCLATKALQSQGQRNMLTLIFLRYQVMAATRVESKKQSQSPHHETKKS
jgi:Zn-dependent alcohol dehydrogenase